MLDKIVLCKVLKKKPKNQHTKKIGNKFELIKSIKQMFK